MRHDAPVSFRPHSRVKECSFHFSFDYYKMVHHGHSPGAVELNSMQLAQRHDVAPEGRSYGCRGRDTKRSAYQYKSQSILSQINMLFQSNVTNQLELLYAPYDICCNKSGNDPLEWGVRPCCRLVPEWLRRPQSRALGRIFYPILRIWQETTWLID